MLELNRTVEETGTNLGLEANLGSPASSASSSYAVHSSMGRPSAMAFRIMACRLAWEGVCSSDCPWLCILQPWVPPLPSSFATVEKLITDPESFGPCSPIEAMTGSVAEP